MRSDTFDVPVVVTQERESPKTLLSSPVAARIVASTALLLIGSGVAFFVHEARLALTDAWVAPLRLSPDNDKVVALRVQQTKDKAERSRLESELLSIEAELKTVDLGLERLESLAASNRRVVVWTSRTARQEKQTLLEQIQNLESQGNLLTELLADEHRQLERTRVDMTAGLVTASELQRASAAIGQTRVQLHSNELQLSRTRAALLEVDRRGRALGGVFGTEVRPMAASAMAPPEVAKSDDDKIRLEIEISRLRSEKRSAQARERAVHASLESMDAILRDLESRPLYRAMRQDTDLAFAPYSHLERLRQGDTVYACAWSAFPCRSVGTVSEIVPGEVTTQDPWGTLQRGQYVVLSMVDRQALNKRVLRIRPEKRGDANTEMKSGEVAQQEAR